MSVRSAPGVILRPLSWFKLLVVIQTLKNINVTINMLTVLLSSSTRYVDLLSARAKVKRVCKSEILEKVLKY